VANILTKVPEDVSRAFYNLQESNNPNFKVIMDWLKDCLKTEEAGCRKLPDHRQIDLCLGRQQALNAFVEASKINTTK
jgi:hypothetical protein